MKGKWKRDLLFAVILALIVGFAVVAAIVLAQEADMEEFCDRTDDGTGLIPLVDPEPGMSCDPRWAGVALGTTYFGLLSLIPVFALIHGGRGVIYLVARRVRRQD